MHRVSRTDCFLYPDHVRIDVTDTEAIVQQIVTPKEWADNILQL